MNERVISSLQRRRRSLHASQILGFLHYPIPLRGGSRGSQRRGQMPGRLRVIPQKRSRGVAPCFGFGFVERVLPGARKGREIVVRNLRRGEHKLASTTDERGVVELVRLGDRGGRVVVGKILLFLEVALYERLFHILMVDGGGG